MARIELTIDAEYCPEWSVWEGCREFVQNTLDGHDRGHERTITHQGGVLTLANRGVVLSRDVLLLGNSSKRGDGGQRGQWGEGLDLGILALVRAGRQVKIRNGGETWTPTIVESDTFDARVPCVFTRKVGSGEDYIAQIEVTAEEWQEFLPRFLDLSPCESLKVQRDGYEVGSLLTDGGRNGWIYCKGIWVQTRDDLCYGYDLANVRVDRDRKMPAEYSLRSEIASMWCGLIANKDGFAERAYRILADDKYTDCNSIPDNIQYTSSFSEDARAVPEKMARVFAIKHGDESYPVGEQAHLLRLAHYGHVGIMVPRRLSTIMDRHFGGFSKVLEEVARLTFDAVPIRSLTEEEQKVYWRGLSIYCQMSSVFRTETVDVLALRLGIVEFKSEVTLAAFDPMRMEIYVSRKMLCSVGDFIGCIIHEKAHEYTMAADGSLIQAQVERELWRSLTRMMMQFVPDGWPNAWEAWSHHEEFTIQ